MHRLKIELPMCYPSCVEDTSGEARFITAFVCFMSDLMLVLNVLGWQTLFISLSNFASSLSRSRSLSLCLYGYMSVCLSLNLSHLK